MTKEQKFKGLLDIARENGYQHYSTTIIIDREFNNLVLEPNFFECLFKDTKFEDLLEFETKLEKPIINAIIGVETDDSYEVFETITVIEYLKLEWMRQVKKGTALDWLFKHFESCYI